MTQEKLSKANQLVYNIKDLDLILDLLKKGDCICVRATINGQPIEANIPHAMQLSMQKAAEFHRDNYLKELEEL